MKAPATIDIEAVMVPISLRDWFAGMALQGYCARPALEKECQQGFALAACDQADAILAARTKGGEA